jgi:hypothetical protein
VRQCPQWRTTAEASAATIAKYLRVAEWLVTERMVLVQPTYYGTHNGLLIQTLRKIGPRAAAWSVSPIPPRLSSARR